MDEPSWTGEDACRRSPADAGRHGTRTGAPEVSTRGPPSVTAIVCSKWAASEPSLVEIDHWSSWMYTSGPPAVIIGSIASVMPSRSSGPRYEETKFGT